MKRKLLVLNLVLLALTAAAGWRLHLESRAAEERDRSFFRQAVRPVPPPPFDPLPAAQPVVPAGYIDIAQKMLFSKDRNPVVVVETVAPPPKPMPPLPVFRGLMNLGDGPAAIMSEKPNARHKEYHPGDMVGPFKLVAVNSQEIVLEWDGKIVKRNVEDLEDRGGSAQQAPAPAKAAPAVPDRPAPPPPPSQGAPGADIGKGIRACVPGDTSPPGTVADGMRKIVTDSPFGQVCRWEPAK